MYGCLPLGCEQKCLLGTAGISNIDLKIKEPVKKIHRKRLRLPFGAGAQYTIDENLSLKRALAPSPLSPTKLILSRSIMEYTAGGMQLLILLSKIKGENSVPLFT